MACPLTRHGNPVHSVKESEMFAISGQLFTAGTGCFFLIEEKEDGTYFCAIYSPYKDLFKSGTTTKDWPRGIREIQHKQDVVEQYVAESLVDAMKWLESVHDY